MSSSRCRPERGTLTSHDGPTQYRPTLDHVCACSRRHRRWLLAPTRSSCRSSVRSEIAVSWQSFLGFAAVFPWVCSRVGISLHPELLRFLCDVWTHLAIGRRSWRPLSFQRGSSSSNRHTGEIAQPSTPLRPAPGAKTILAEPSTPRRCPVRGGLETLASPALLRRPRLGQFCLGNFKIGTEAIAGV
jgi:hypothetical protein